MAERDLNTLLSDAAAPSNGINRAMVKHWMGGPIRVTAAGNFAGATVELLMTIKFPADGDVAEYLDTVAHPDNQFIVLHTFTAGGAFNLENLNPCALAVRVSNTAVGTRVRVGIG
jgi:hypothetical protein